MHELLGRVPSCDAGARAGGQVACMSYMGGCHHVKHMQVGRWHARAAWEGAIM